MRRFAFIIIPLFLYIGIDVFGKWYVEEVFSRTHSSYFPILGEYIGIELFYNSGVAFSLPITGLPLQILTVLLIGILIYSYFRYEYPKKQTLLDIGYTMILAGAFSHAYERIFIGHVVDFISVKYFAILNFADIFISVGAFFIIVYYVFFESSRRG